MVKPPRANRRQFERMQKDEFETLYQGKGDNQKFIDIERHGDGFIVPEYRRTDIQLSVDTQTGALPSITIGEAGIGIYEILTIHSSCVMAADVADRVVNLRYTPYTALTYTNNGKWGWISSGITQSASQQGTIHITQGQQYVYNDNGSVASSAANPLPFLCTGGSIIDVNSTNLKAGDQHSLRVYYRRVGEV